MQGNRAMSESGKPRILVADDVDAMRQTTLLFLRLEGYEPFGAGSGRTAIDLMEQDDFDLALLDIGMPVVDGIGVVEHMKSKERLRDIPVIMITGSMDASHVLRCKTLGVTDYMVKPYKFADLLKRIQMTLGRKTAG